ncbi:MAG TPA: carboxypeptidase regulatory-like domain-containing protein [Acidobacteriaceae bacterium]|nr:carboxypeptidase regulatory-like domain-containing protein [Acidobacteriaceae bacterium]
MTRHRQSAAHLDADQLNAFLAGALSEEARRESLAHLAECEECRGIIFLAQAAVPQPTPQKSAAKPWTRWLPAFALAGATAAAVVAAVVWTRPHPAMRPMEPQVAVARPPATAALPPAQAPPTSGPSRPTMNAARTRSETTRAREAAPEQPTNAIQQPGAGVMGGAIGALGAGPSAATSSAPQRQEATPAAAPQTAETGNAPGIPAMKAARPAMAKAAPAQQQPAPNAPALKDERAAAGFGADLHALDLKIEPNQGSQDGRSELKGTVLDQSGAVIPGAHITLQRSADRSTAALATSDSQGQFTVAAVPPGQYAIQISAPGFKTETRPLDLHARDLALLSPVLQVGSSSQTVAVTAAAPTLDTSSAEVAASSTAVFSLPGRVAPVQTVQQGGRILALDAAGTLFFSRDAGKHWKKVKPVWKSAVAQLALATQANDSSVPANEQTLKASGKVAPVFQITTAGGAVWLSSDGLHWHLG